MYKRLDRNFIKRVDDWSIFKGNPRYAYDSMGVTIAYYDIANMELFKSLHSYDTLLPIEPEWVEYAEMTGSGNLYPHRDHGTVVSLNYYASASDMDVTSFYYPKIDAKPQKYPGKDVSNIYTFDDVEMPPYASFSAKSDESYVFQTGNIHGVNKNSTETRTIICYQWAHRSYFSVLKGLTNE